MRALIIDDEPGAREVLYEMVCLYTPEIKVVGMGGDVEEAVKLVKKHKPELIFLDVVMPGNYGFTLLEKLAPNAPAVIFTTAHDRFALRAMKMAALDYLLKPIHPDELTQAVEKAVVKKNMEGTRKKLSVFRANQQSADPQLVLPTPDGHMLARLSEIVFFQVEKKLVKVRLNNREEYLITLNIGELDEILSTFGFFRPHRSYLVNLKTVKKLTRSLELEIEGDSYLPLAQGKKDMFLKQFLSLKK